MTFTVTSKSFKDGGYLGADHILSADFGFGCAGGEQVAASLPVKVDTSAAIVGFQLNFNTLAKAAIMGLYKR